MATRTDVVQDASFRVGDLEIGLLTGALDSTHPIDTGRTEPDGHWNDAWLSINGIERRVTGYIRPGLFTTNAYPSVPHVGDKYELRRDQLHTRNQMVAFCNAAIRDVQFTAWVLIDSYLDALGDLPLVIPDTTAYQVPSQMECVYSILYQQPLETNDANWYPVDHNQWFVNEPGFVTVYDNLQMPDSSRVRLLGTRRPAEMIFDTSLCEVEPSFVAVYAAKLMALRMMKSSEADRMKTIYAAMKQEEDVIRRTMRLRQPINVRRVRPTGTGATSGPAPVPISEAYATQWYTGSAPPTFALGRPGDMYLQDTGDVWEFKVPGGWTLTGTNIEGPPGDVDAAILEYAQPDEPLDVVP